MSTKFIGKTWELNIPVGPPGHPMVIPPQDLDTYDSAFFHTLPDRVVLSAPCNATTTLNSNYPRSELREMNASLASWDTSKGTHTMSYTAAVLHLPKNKPQIVVGQVHGIKDDLFEIRLTGSHLEVIHNAEVFGTLITNYVLGDFFDIVMKISKDSVSITGSIKPLTFKLKTKSKSSYFKLGAYVQSNASHGDGNDYGAVAIKKCFISHKE